MSRPNNIRTKVAQFLEANSDFCFDVEDYLISTKHCESLSRRFSLFISSLSKKHRPVYSPQLILERISEGDCRSVAAYANYNQLASFSSLPFVTKNLLRESPNDFLSSEYGPGQLWEKSTSGTTGPPIPIYYSPEFYVRLLYLTPRKIAARAGMTGVGRRPVFCLSVSDIRSINNSVFVDPTNAVGMMLQVIVDSSRPQTFARVFELIRQEQPECISTKPSLFELLVEYSAEFGGVGNRPPLFLISGGQLLADDLRQRLAELFGGAPVVDAYGMTEVGLIASECSHRQLHLDDLSFWAETDENRDSELILSSLENLAMPLIRFRTGDRTRIEFKPCICGTRGPRLVDFFGRRVSCFIMSTGEKLSPTCFNDLFGRFPGLREFQIVQRTNESFEVHVEFDRELRIRKRKKAMEDIARHVSKLLPTHPSVLVSEQKFKKLPKFERYQTLVNSEL